MKEAHNQAAMNAWSEKYLEIYEYWQIRDAADRYGKERDLGLEFEKGIEKGIDQRNIEIARNLLFAGVAVDVIMQATGLSREEIEALMT